MTVAVKPDQTLDLTGLACPLVMAKTKKVLSEMESGQILEIQTTDACTEFDLPSWINRTGQELVNTVKEQELIKFYIKKK